MTLVNDSCAQRAIFSSEASCGISRLLQGWGCLRFDHVSVQQPWWRRLRKGVQYRKCCATPHCPSLEARATCRPAIEQISCKTGHKADFIPCRFCQASPSYYTLFNFGMGPRGSYDMFPHMKALPAAQNLRYFICIVVSQ